MTFPDADSVLETLDVSLLPIESPGRLWNAGEPGLAKVQITNTTGHVLRNVTLVASLGPWPFHGSSSATMAPVSAYNDVLGLGESWDVAFEITAKSAGTVRFWLSVSAEVTPVGENLYWTEYTIQP